MLENNEWKKLKVADGTSWIEIAIVLKAKDTNEEKVNWEKIYGTLTRGNYRLIKKVNTITLIEEFEIK